MPLPQCGCVLEGPGECSFTLGPPALSSVSALKMGGWSVIPFQTAPVTRNAQCRMGYWSATPAPADSARFLGAGAYSTFDGHLGNSGESCTLLLQELERGEPEEELEPIIVALEQEDMEVQWVMVMASAHRVTVVVDGTAVGGDSE